MPRRAREPSLRNSAISLRNFGTRSASRPAPTRLRAMLGAGGGGPQRKGPSDCLTKTQVSAKPQGEV
jgi:hypothetical protein